MARSLGRRVLVLDDRRNRARLFGRFGRSRPGRATVDVRTVAAARVFTCVAEAARSTVSARSSGTSPRQQEHRSAFPPGAVPPAGARVLFRAAAPAMQTDRGPSFPDGAHLFGLMTNNYHDVEEFSDSAAAQDMVDERPARGLDAVPWAARTSSACLCRPRSTTMWTSGGPDLGRHARRRLAFSERALTRGANGSVRRLRAPGGTTRARGEP